MFANSYKGLIGSILVSIPFDDLDKDIYIRNNGEIRLNPKYIIGYLPIYENHHLESIITVEEIKNTMEERINEGEPYIGGETVNKYKNHLKNKMHI